MSSDPLRMPVQFLKGVGPARARALAALDIETVGDLLGHLPFRYEHAPKSISIGYLRVGEIATVVGMIRKVNASRGRTRASIAVDVEDGTGTCRVRWFNAPYLRDRFRVGDVIRLTGKPEDAENKAQFVNPSFTLIEPEADPFAEDEDRFTPVYPATAELASKEIARIVRAALEHALDAVEESLPDALRRKRKLPPLRTAVARVHQPINAEDAVTARRRLAYDELLLMQLAVQRRRRTADASRGAPRLIATPEIDERIRARLPFALTAAQDRAVADIVADLAGEKPMARLLQGDVGSGKTAVALYAALTAIANRGQVAMLLPTEILARQMHERVTRYLTASKVRIALLSGGMKAQQRNALLHALARGELDWVIGTHALLEADVVFRKLALAIVDEQHRFGVAQRERLRKKGDHPHFLIMSATPIPRTLAMTFHGDLDVTTIDALPPGRQPITTRLVGRAGQERQAAWAFVRERLANGERAYIVYPLVEESAELDLKAATVEAETLRNGALRGFNVGLVHGRLPADEKSQALEAFRRGDLHALVATTVIEVGVDVPEATVMVIEHAERYGLAQLHQLRGRVGRGDRAATCLLLSDSDAEDSNQRLRVICKTQDGFEIAEADLRFRGPGELVGKRQHGMPALKAANLIDDLDLLQQARDDAADLLARDPDLTQAAHRALRNLVLAKYEPTTQTQGARS